MWDKILTFLSSLWRTLSETLIYIGTPYDLIFALIDVLILSFIFYTLLKIVRDSRAWQLLKGLIFIVVLGIVSNFVGLTALGFLLSRTISLFAIAFVVLFQPELRRTLETVGRTGFKIVSNEDTAGGILSYQAIEALVQACGEMAEKRTGALIVIERTTPLGDLTDQENAVEVDANISATMLKQIFYVGSPLHDGAVLIRHGRIAAARIHVPLTEAYHLRKDLGTRHRAAIGSSEIGDTISIVVSEERGTISIGVDGRLYTLDNEDALRMQLHRLLLPETTDKKRRFTIKRRSQSTEYLQSGPTKKTKAGLAVLSALLAVIFWFFVQISVNPVLEQSYQVPLLYSAEESLEEKGLAVQYRIMDVRVVLRGRRNTLESLSNRSVSAYVDLSQVDQAGSQECPIQVTTNSNRFTNVDSISPGKVTIVVRPIHEEGSK